MRRVKHARGTALVTVANAELTYELWRWLRARDAAPRLVFLWGGRVTLHGVFRLRGAQ